MSITQSLRGVFFVPGVTVLALITWIFERITGYQGETADYIDDLVNACRATVSEARVIFIIWSRTSRISLD